jgi:hypothetical protein
MRSIDGAWAWAVVGRRVYGVWIMQFFENGMLPCGTLLRRLICRIRFIKQLEEYDRGIVHLLVDNHGWLSVYYAGNMEYGEFQTAELKSQSDLDGAGRQGEDMNCDNEN